ncbi:hypothetical protein ACKKBG_A00435 [Auxenochlorella protothecoides x Auxenochlorella symbiontica]
MELPSRPLDEGEAGAVWRSHRLRTLESRLQGLDLGDEQAAEVVALLQRVREETAVLDAMWQAQRAPDYQPRWWQDGELDRERADRHNDAGTAALAAGNPGPAFEEFTQAIRLWPSSPAYHSNRAAAALKLARFGVAAEDARDALRLDPGSARAALRLAKAQAGSRDPAAAVEAYSLALQLAEMGSPEGSTARAARRGLAAARAALESADAGRVRDRAEARRGLRAGIPRRPLDPEAAAAALESARAVVGANPGSHAAHAALAEAAIACGRWEDAGAAVAGMHPGLDADYLQAEVAWRRGDVASALTLLGQGGQSGTAAVPDDASDGSRRAAGHEAMAEGSRSAAERGSVIDGQDVTEPGSPEQPARTPGPPPLPDKMKDLAAFLAPISVLLAAADAAEEEEIQEDVADACGAALDHLLACAGDGLRAVLHARRGAARAARNSLDSALEDARAALRLAPGLAPALALQARLLTRLGRHTEAFLAWRQAERAAPGTPGLAAETAAAAARCAGQQAAAAATGGSGLASSDASRSALSTLGIEGGAAVTHASLRAAYRRAAATWHPDKWGGRGEEARLAAEERFKVVQLAYEELQACVS